MGLKGFYYLIALYNADIENEIVSLNLSIGSLIAPAYLRKIGPNPYQSHILSNRLLGSKILTGKETPIIL